MLCKIECLSMKEMGSSDLGFILGENEQIGNHFIAYSSFQAFSDQLSQMSTCIKCFEIFGKLDNGWKWDFGEKIRTIYKIHESSKVESKFPAFWIHLLFIFLASIYCPALTCPSIVCSPKFICLLSSSVLSNVSLPWVHPLFHFTKFNCSVT